MTKNKFADIGKTISVYKLSSSIETQVSMLLLFRCFRIYGEYLQSGYLLSSVLRNAQMGTTRYRRLLEFLYIIIAVNEL